MTKRAPHFDRRSNDLYPTPASAVTPLVPFLHADGVDSFAEVCCGDGSLIRHLETYNFHCAYQGDIATGQDAGAYQAGPDVDAIITNPPWRRPDLHRLITHLRRQRPSWLLLDGDWHYTRQAFPFLAHCSHIVTVGRLRWIPGSPHTGMDSCAWLRFQAGETETRFFGRDAATTSLPLFSDLAK